MTSRNLEFIDPKNRIIPWNLSAFGKCSRVMLACLKLSLHLRLVIGYASLQDLGGEFAFAKAETFKTTASNNESY
ncbi:hypothetical protein [Nonlabens agnitus]|uniref:hypothetical protein n=1 Tax=Nonlabens agnitus TaxID=870484 RepID=UPI00155836B6|nr:hypothetical protein [Nonlabens agnitus]